MSALELINASVRVAQATKVARDYLARGGRDAEHVLQLLDLVREDADEVVDGHGAVCEALDARGAQ